MNQSLFLDGLKIMNNEPVAVVDHRQQNGVTWLKIKKGKSVMPDHNTLLYIHPVKELHLSLQKTEDGELVAVTYTDDEHRIVEVLWERPPAKTLTDEEILEVAKKMGWRGALGFLVRFARAILRKAEEK